MLIKYKISNILFKCLLFYIISIKINKINGACDTNQFECDNGHCISTSSKCDGSRNCPDGSDETAANCINERSYCLKPFHVCPYGGCVTGTAPCNNEQDCADGSDETPLRCGTEDDRLRYEKRLQGNCQYDEMKCPSGICISNHKKCDGNNDCGDAFDETVELCGHVECPGYSFTCGYGGCISDELKCNGIKNCVDGSDEAPKLCNLTVNTAILTSTGIRTEVQVGCPLPTGDERPIAKDRYNAPWLLPILNGEVRFSCKKGYHLVGQNISYCADQIWSTEVPKCLKYCNPKQIISGYSTKPRCHYDGEEVHCNQKHPPGTVVTYLCSTYFTNSTTLPTLTCRNGHWSGARMPCDAKCGQIAQPTQEFSAYGITVNNSVVPWHVGIYSNLNEVTYNFTCGGTILTPDLIITAAHCVWDNVKEKPYSAELFQVVAAKFYRDYYREEFTAVYRNVSQINMMSNYKGAKDNYINDIAMLRLEKPLEFTNLIRPVCLEFFENSEKVSKLNLIEGQFAGWQFDGDRTFQFVQAVSNSYQACRSENNIDLASDKFCILNRAGGRACRGDSGGAFTHFKETSYFMPSKAHSLLGVISNAPGADQCAAGIIVLTNVQFFKDFIEKYVYESYNQRG